jgi:hypothetical protein
VPISRGCWRKLSKSTLPDSGFPACALDFVLLGVPIYPTKTPHPIWNYQHCWLLHNIVDLSLATQKSRYKLCGSLLLIVIHWLPSHVQARQLVVCGCDDVGRTAKASRSLALLCWYQPCGKMLLGRWAYYRTIPLKELFFWISSSALATDAV